MTLKGITQKEIFILDRNIGNKDSGFSAENTFQEVVKVLKKAIELGNTLEDLALHLNLQATTMLYRHIYIFDRTSFCFLVLIILPSSSNPGISLKLRYLYNSFEIGLIF